MSFQALDVSFVQKKKYDTNVINARRVSVFHIPNTTLSYAPHPVSCQSCFGVVYLFLAESPTNVGPSSRREVDSDQLLWIILSAVFGVSLIVSTVVIIVCYRRRKKSRRDQGG